MTQTITKFDKKDNTVSVYADHGQGRHHHSYVVCIEQLDVRDLIDAFFAATDFADFADEGAIRELQDNVKWIAGLAHNKQVWVIEGMGNHDVPLHYTSQYHPTKKSALETAMRELTC